MAAIDRNDSYHQDYKIIIQKVRIFQAKDVCRCCNIVTVAKGNPLPIRKGKDLYAEIFNINNFR